MIKVVSVTFKTGNKPYYFIAGDAQYEKGMGVIVETAKGLEYATVVEPFLEIEESQAVTPLKPVIRIATDRDKEMMQKNAARRDEALKTVQEKIRERGLEMKPVDCEISFDGSKITVYFTSENRVDFRELIKDLSSAFHMRIELRQIGIRDEIKLIGGLAPCGRVCCCSGCMEEPQKVSVKMAKNQGLSLNPGKISGLCGRLMCCLAYENDYYADVCKRVPKIGSEVQTPDGTGTAINVNMLKMIVKVKFEKGETMSFKDYSVDQIRFKRGNVVMGKVDDDDDDDDEEALEAFAEEPVQRQQNPSRPEGQQGGDRRHGKPNHGGQNNQRGGDRGGNEQKGNNNNRQQKGGQRDFNKQNSGHGNGGNRRQNGGRGEGGNRPKNNAPQNGEGGAPAARQNFQGGRHHGHRHHPKPKNNG